MNIRFAKYVVCHLLVETNFLLGNLQAELDRPIMSRMPSLVGKNTDGNFYKSFASFAIRMNELTYSVHHSPMSFDVADSVSEEEEEEEDLAMQCC